ncbi:MAG: hypothetical protein ABR985_18895 [Methanotrichaceae archaeon]
MERRDGPHAGPGGPCTEFERSKSLSFPMYGTLISAEEAQVVMHIGETSKQQVEQLERF